jgi:hypothetical protein
MIETDEATELEALQARKLADARHALRAFEEAWEAFLHARDLHEDRLKEHAARRAAFEEQKKRYEAFLGRLEERRQRAAGIVRGHLRVDPRHAEELADILRRHLEPWVQVHAATRQTVVLPRKRGTAIAFEPKSVPAKGLRRGLGGWILRLVPRHNRFLYTYRVSYTRGQRVRDEEELARAIAFFVAERANASLAAAVPREDRPLFVPGWIPIPPEVFAALLARVLGPRGMEEGALESNNPSETKESLERDPSLRLHLELAPAREIIRIVNEELFPRLVERVPLMPRNDVAPPVDPGPPPAEPEPPRLVPGTTRLWEELPWEAHLERLRVGEERAPSQHMLLGYEPVTAEPIYLSRPLLHAHAHVVGATQTGKTSAALMPLVTQLIRGSDEAPRPGELVGPPPPLLIIDLKGDFALFHTARLEAKRRGRAFHYFTTHPEKDSHVFDIFGSLASLIPTPADLGGFFAQAFDIFHGPGYGHGYYSKENREALVRGVDQAREQSGEAPTLTTLGEALKTTASKKTGHDAREAQATLAPLVRPEIAARLERRDGTDPSRVIHMPTAIEQREVLYFWIPVLRSTAGLDIARLALYSFMHAVAERHYTRGERRAYAIIDEFQEVASFNIGRLLTFSAGVGLSLVMANQSVKNLKVGSTDIRDHVTTNANLRLFFSVATSDDIEELQALSGEKTVWTRSKQKAKGGSHSTLTSTTETETFSESKGKNWGKFFSQMWGHSSGTGSTPQGGTSNSGYQESQTKGESSGDSTTKGQSKATGKTTGTTDSEDWRKSKGRTETVRPGLDANDILDASLVDRACLVHSKRDAGKTLLGGRPRPIRCLYSMDAEEYGARRGTVWPQSTVPPPAPPASDRPTPSSPPPRSPKPAPSEPEHPPKEHPKRRERGVILQTFFDEHAPPPLREGST